MSARPVALITGASGGVGRQIARAFAGAGHDLVLHYRLSSPELELLAEELTGGGTTCVLVSADLTQDEGVARVVAAVPGSRLDVLINNAGTYPATDFLGAARADWEAVLALNVIAPFACIRAAVPLIPEGGSILNIASIAAHRGSSEQAAYAASKAALVSLTRSAAVELGSHGIRVNAVSPGLVDRPRIEESWPDGVRRWRDRALLDRLVDPSGVAAACLFLAGPGAAAITGQEHVIDSGVSVAPHY